MNEKESRKKIKYNSSFFLNTNPTGISSQSLLNNNNSNLNLTINKVNLSQNSSLKNSQIMDDLSTTGLEKISLKSTHMTKILKNMYTDEAGKTIHNLKLNNKHLRMSSMKGDMTDDKMGESLNISNTLYKTEKKIPNIFKNQSNHKSSKSLFSNNNDPLINPYNNQSMNNSNSPFSFKNLNESIKTHFLPELKLSMTNRNANVFKNSQINNQFYCPCCPHCNKLQEEVLESYIFSIKEAKNVLSRSVEYAINNNLMSKSNLDIFNVSESSNVLKDNNYTNIASSNDPQTQEPAFDFESFHNNFPKQLVTNNRSTYQIVAHFLNALIEDKMTLDYLVPPEISKRLEHLLVPRGLAFEKSNSNEEVIYDEELEKLFDGKTKEIIKNLFKKKYLATDNTNNLMELKKENDKTIYEHRKKFLVLFLIFIQILAEISVECKEKASLLYKFFKLYFVEQEHKWIIVVNKMKEKIHYYRELCKTVIHQKNKHLDKIESINDILFSQKLTKENLQDHKKLIQDLLGVVNEKREEIYILKADKEILLGELRTMVYDYDAIKLNKEIRDQFLKFSNEAAAKNVNEEMKHKNLSREVKSLLVNADKYLIISGQRNYFYDQKNYYLKEIERLTEIYQKAYFKKRDYKKKLIEKDQEIIKVSDNLQMEITFLRNKISVDKEAVSVQTDIDFYEFNKMRKNHDLIYIHKRLTTNKLQKFIERIQYDCSKNKPISMKSLMSFLPDLYNEKIENDHQADMDGGKKLFLDDFLFKYMTEKFKLKRIINKNTEEIIMAVMKYSKEDPRIDLLRRFLGVGDDKIRREVLDMYLTFLKNLPISFFKLFDEEYNSYLMNTELCFEIYHSRYPQFNLVNENRLSLLKNSTVIDAGSSENKKVKDEKKLDLFLINRFYNKSYILITDLLNDFKNNNITETDLTKIAEQLQNVNKEFKLSMQHCTDILKNNFTVKAGKLNLDTFFNFFAHNKVHFKIKIVDFIEISLNYLVTLFNLLEKKIFRLYEEADVRKIGLIYYKEFEDIITKLMGGVENKWKVNEYFK